jgi:hypothetical protein
MFRAFDAAAAELGVSRSIVFPPARRRLPI